MRGRLRKRDDETQSEQRQLTIPTFWPRMRSIFRLPIRLLCLLSVFKST